MTTPEALACRYIDTQLDACGWVMQDRADINLYTNRGSFLVPLSSPEIRLQDTNC
jgi:hypothetical protein